MFTTIKRLAAAALLIAAGCQSTVRTTGPASKQEPIVQSRVCNLDSAPAGTLPSGWEPDQTQPTKALATWQVIKDPSAPSAPNVIALTRTENERRTFNLLILEQPLPKDLDCSVKVKANTGKIDQGGGPIWRCYDQNNYYICRVNPLENNYRVYRVVNDRRKQLASANVKLEAGKWYTLRATMIGDHIVCYLDGKKMLEARDGTIPWAGRIGLWTKADAVTAFDDLTVKSIAGP